MSSTTSNKSRLVLFLMVVIALVFFISSFLAAALNGSSEDEVPAPASVPAADEIATSAAAGNYCFIVKTVEGKWLADCGI